ncbi:MAG: helix-turn-helix transcriptional regulator, partial [Bacteroidota bacterium]
MSRLIPVYHIDQNIGTKAGGFFRILQLKGSTENEPFLDQATYENNSPHRQNFFEICIFSEGEGIHEIDFKSYNIKPKSIHLVAPGQVHNIHKKKSTSGYILAFNRDFFALFSPDKDIKQTVLVARAGMNNTIFNLSNKDFNSFLDIVKRMIQESRTNGKHTHQVLKSYLHIFILKLSEFSTEVVVPEIKKNDKYILVNSFKKAVEQHYKELHLVKDYADLLNVDPIRLNKICKKLTSKTAGTIITDRIILEARRQLVFSSFTNKEIAHYLNFEDPSYFSRVFRKKTGFSPTAFREQ